MKIQVLYATFKEGDMAAIYQKWLPVLPAVLRQVNARYRRLEDRVRNLVGKVLLHKALEEGAYGAWSLHDISYSRLGKPLLPADIHFSISHSGAYVCCVIGEGVCLGIDIEQIRPIDFNDVSSVMNTEEWMRIREAGDPVRVFYDFWTQKEAVVKAEGVGFMVPVDLQIGQGVVSALGRQWYVTSLNIDPDYSCHLVASELFRGVYVNRIALL